MTVAVNHATPADSNFGPAGAAAWDEPHAVTGLATVAETGAYADLTGKPTLGTAAAAATTDFDAAGAATAAVATHVGLADPHTQYALESSLGTLATQNGTFSGTSSGTNTGDQTTVSGNAGTATTLQNARNINGVSFNGSADIKAADVIRSTAAALADTIADGYSRMVSTDYEITDTGTLELLGTGSILEIA